MEKINIKMDINGKVHEMAVQPGERLVDVLRDRLGHHIHGEIWASNIKEKLDENGLLSRPIHIISANMHSVMNSIYGPMILKEQDEAHPGMALFELIGEADNKGLRKKIKKGAGCNYQTFFQQ